MSTEEYVLKMSGMESVCGKIPRGKMSRRKKFRRESVEEGLKPKKKMSRGEYVLGDNIMGRLHLDGNTRN